MIFEDEKIKKNEKVKLLKSDANFRTSMKIIGNVLSKSELH